MAASKDCATLLPSPVEHLQDKSSMEATTMDITVEVEMAFLTISETRRDVEEEEQLANICYISLKTSKWASTDSKYLLHEKEDLFNMSVGHKKVAEMINPTDQVEKSLEFKLCHIVMSVGHKKVAEMINSTDQEEKSLEFELCHTVPDNSSSMINNKVCSTVSNSECKAENNICKTSIQQCHTCIYANKQCRRVGEQVGITMTFLANFCWDRPKQMQKMFAVVLDPGMLNKRNQDQDQPI